MIRLILLLTLSLSLHAQNDFEDYRQHGIDFVLKKWNKQLESKEYWEKKLASKDLLFGYFENEPEVFFCDKNCSTLSLYKVDENGSYKEEKNFLAYTGKNSGDKQFEGDLKTPIGIYDITQRLTQVDQFYGPLALVTSYPNFYDKIRKKSGSGIWIHGLPLDGDRDTYTKGCIAIHNNELEEISNKIDIKHTKLIIQSSKIGDINKTNITDLMAQLYQWKNAWVDNNFSRYINFYSPKFKRFDGKNYTQFIQMKKYIFSLGDIKKIHISNINILPYPDTSKLYQITFREEYHSIRTTFKGDKILIVKQDENGSMKIIAEK